MTRGLPASGKTTWAKASVKQEGRIKRINKDDLREMIDCGVWSKINERNILEVRDFMIELYLTGGFDVIVDDTNFNPIHEKTLRDIAKRVSAEFEIKDFDTPLEECIKRDLVRENGVGEKVIRDMYDKYLAKKDIKKIEYIQDAPSAIICDIDGTLAINNGTRSPYEWHRVGEDDLCYEINNLLKIYQKEGYTIILVSGRDSVCRSETEAWLDKYGVKYGVLLMRNQDDNRKDVIVKQEIYDKYIKGKFNIEFVLDDRDQVVKMWRENNLKCLQAAEGNF